ncbi:MAG: class I lanthipeptide [Bacteroides sp.]
MFAGKQLANLLKINKSNKFKKMEQKKIFLEKEVIARLQDEEMSHIMGASSHSNTSSSKDIEDAEPISDSDEDSGESKSCCQKSCNGGN